MKKIKYIMIFILLFMIFPSISFALSDEESANYLNQIIEEVIVNNETWEVKDAGNNRFSINVPVAYTTDSVNETETLQNVIDRLVLSKSSVTLYGYNDEAMENITSSVGFNIIEENGKISLNNLSVDYDNYRGIQESKKIKYSIISKIDGIAWTGKEVKLEETYTPSIRTKVYSTSCDNQEFKCLICKYDYKGLFSYSYTYRIIANGLGTASVEIVEETGQKYLNSIESKLKVGDFYNSGKDDLVCPTIKAITEVNENNDNIDVTLLKNSNQAGDSISPTILEDNHKSFIDSDRESTNFICDIYSKDSRIPMIHATFANGGVTYSIESDRYQLDHTFIQKDEIKTFAKGCNHTFYVNCDNDSDTCFISLTKLPGFSVASGMDSTSDEIERDEKYENAQNGNDDFKPDPLCGENGENCDISIQGICGDPKVARTLQFLGFLLFIAKILVPAIIIIMGIVNLVKIITSGKTDDAPKYVKNIIARIVIGVVIFILPGLINFIFDIANDVIHSDSDVDGFENCVTCILNPQECEIDN